MAGPSNGNWRGGATKHYLYDIYMDMIGRCERSSHKRFADYGGRGVSVCDRWRKDFWDFVADVGDRPDASEPKLPGVRSKWSIDRIDNDGNYEPGNVRWSSYSQQSKNRRKGAYAGVLQGSLQKGSRLTESQVVRCVSLVGEGSSQAGVARHMGVSTSLVSMIMKGKRWAWLTGIGEQNGS